MPCYHPLMGYRSKTLSDTGKRPIVFNPNEGYSDMRVELPCGQCIGCRLERSRQWAIRCVHEAQMHKENCFITLTFNEENLTKSLVKTDFQKFMKRLRKRYPDKKIRYFHCGEYGPLNMRPHHHACLFGHAFNDLEFFKETNGVKIFTSETLSKIWKKGFVTVGEVTFKSAAYVARYIMKKITGKDAEQHYKKLGIIPEYTTMSRRPGIGTDWLKKFNSDVFPFDEVVIREKIVCRPPKFYDSMFESSDPKAFADIKKKRLSAARNNRNSIQRLADGELIKSQQLKQLRRDI